MGVAGMESDSIYNLSGLTYFAVHQVHEIHLGRACLFVWVDQGLCNHWSVEEHLRYFQIFPVLNKAAMSIHAQIGILQHSLFLNPTFKLYHPVVSIPPCHPLVFENVAFNVCVIVFHMAAPQFI